MAEDILEIKRKTRVAVYWDFFNKFSTQGLSFLFGIILARLLSPSDYGIIALPMVFFALSQCFIDCGFSSALIRKPQLANSDLNTAFYFNVIVGVVCYIILFWASPYIADFYGVPILSDLLKVTALTTVFTPLQSVHFALLSRNLNYKIPAIISFSNCLISGSFGIYFAYSGYGVWALVYQGLLGNIVNLVLIWSFSKWRPKLLWSKESFNYLFGFGGKMLASGLLDAIHDNIYPIVIGKLYSARDLGLYNRSQGYAQLPFKQINGIMDGISFPVLSKLQGDDLQLSLTFIRFLKLIIFVICPIMLGLSALAYPIVILMITEKWVECVPLLQLLCFAIILWPIQTLNFTLLKVKGRSDLLLRLNIGIKILGFIVMCFTVPHGIMAIGYGSIVHALLAFLWITYYTGKVSNASMKVQIKAIIPILLLGCCMYLLVHIVVAFFESLMFQLIIGVLLGTFFYLFMAYVFRFTELKDVKFLFHMK